ncbi:hypothetical protein [Nocardia sp. NPDC059239]|uniref:hypothetical protein n=1 Tax=unclassified Nocardia TaxID=2637762 RepID=UPI00368EEAAD
MSRAIAVYKDGPRGAVEDWLKKGACRKAGSSWHLSRTAVISLYPAFDELSWTGPDLDEAGIEKGVFE